MASLVLNSKLGNPKKSNSKKDKKLFNYYAGYSENFVESIFDNVSLSPKATVLDPWNGAGTTTKIASKRNLKSTGIDINPCMKHVASSDLFVLESHQSRKELMTYLKKRFSQIKLLKIPKDDPLLVYFDKKSVVYIRSLVLTISKVSTGRALAKIKKDYLFSFLFVQLIQTLKSTSSIKKGSNPTWVRKPKNKDDKFKIKNFESFQESYLNSIQHSLDRNNIFLASPDLEIGDSTAMKVKSRSVDLILTSPPYCTRIDYVMSTILELFLLGYSDIEIRALRDYSLGTPTIFIEKEKVDFQNINSQTCRDVLEQILLHKSYASSKYYIKFYFQYFLNLQKSLEEAVRVLKKNGKAVFVVQDSFYKDLKIPLNTILIEMMEAFEFNCMLEQGFLVSNNMIHINSKSKKYRTKNIQTEYVLMFGRDYGSQGKS